MQGVCPNCGSLAPLSGQTVWRAPEHPKYVIRQTGAAPKTTAVAPTPVLIRLSWGGREGNGGNARSAAAAALAADA